ncbi:hypothetical protein C8J56DRAFT_896242 [Mycena floridula]|nr:hypothetical protein C8J56DRAFT_896242 [Mycena floridula]
MQSSRPLCPHCHKDTSFQPETATQAKWLELKALLRSPQTSTPAPSSAFLAGLKADLRKCQQEIDRQKNYLTTLKNKQKLLQRHLEATKTLAAPIRQTPPEILDHIFTLACGWNCIAANKINIPALTIARVCSHWRSIIFSNKAVWFRINWTYMEAGFCEASYSSESLAQGIELLLKHSDGQPLDVVLAFDSGVDEDYDELEKRWLLILAESQRWRSLSIDHPIMAG